MNSKVVRLKILAQVILHSVGSGTVNCFDHRNRGGPSKHHREGASRGNRISGAETDDEIAGCGSSSDSA